MTPDQAEAIARQLIQLSAICGALAALCVLLLLLAVRRFTDWFLDREEASRRIAAARARSHRIRQSEEGKGGTAHGKRSACAVPPCTP